jgi:hypothetical protein
MSRVPKKKTEGDKFGDFPKKWAKYLDDDYAAKVQQSSAEDLNKLIVEANEMIANLEKDYAADDEINQLKLSLKEAEFDIKTAIKTCNAKSRYCVAIKRSLGAKTSGDE